MKVDMAKHIKLTQSQKEAVEVWIFDPMYEGFPGTLSGLGLLVEPENLEAARQALAQVIRICSDADALKDLSALANRL